MMHNKRRWCLSIVETAEELAEKLTQHTWTLCTAFSVRGHEDVVFLNDATSENGAQEYAVMLWCTFIEGQRTGVQIESVTFSWCSQAEALEIIRPLLTHEDDSVIAVEVYPVIQTPEQHGRCHLCA
jgi:hypothetical protein